MSRASLVAMAVMAALLAVLMAASSREVFETGFLLYFQEEGRGVATEGTLLLVLFCGALTLMVGAYADPRNAGLAAVANVALKATLAAAIIFMLAFPSLPQFDNKSMLARAILFPIVALSFAAWWAARRAPGPYPSLVDASWTLVLAFDIVGNDLHWYGNWGPWDDTVHFLSSLPAMFVVVPVLMAWFRRGRFRVGFATAAVLSVAIYMSLHSFWEMAEFLSDQVAGTELQPGGMAEATANSLAAFAGSLLAIGVLAVWHRSGALEDAFVRPLALLFAPGAGELAGEAGRWRVFVRRA